METEVQSIDTNVSAPAAPETKWYVLRVVSGKEKKINQWRKYIKCKTVKK
jgi:hypothetical protein